MKNTKKILVLGAVITAAAYLLSVPVHAASMEAQTPIPKFVTLRDPFEVGFSYKKAEVSTVPENPNEAAPVVVKRYLELQGIFMTGDARTAIIDDKVVSEGSLVAGGFRVSSIRSDSVIISRGGKAKTLRLK
ncbi:MAG: hypothetical protein WC624_04810 [Candidatus Margulisiibacteriota bacterium]